MNRRRQSKRRLPAPLIIAFDVICAALLLGIFYYTNYMMKVAIMPVSLPTPARTVKATNSAIPSSTALPTTRKTSVAPTGTGVISRTTGASAQTATPDPNNWRAKFADKFTLGATEQTANSYKSANISITITQLQKYNVTCYVADIYIADLKYFKTAFAKNPDVMGDREMTDKVANENGAILAINGDHCVDNLGTVVRNGKMYRETKSSSDVLVMNYDGTMQGYSPDDFSVDKIKSEGAYQVWTFNAILLQDGQPMQHFNTTLTGVEPRTAIGYYEPGHYCFLVVGGRQANGSEGYTLTQLSQIMYDLGCKVAYNLDGGRSSEMIFLGKMLNQQSPRRPTTDIIYVGEN